MLEQVLKVVEEKGRTLDYYLIKNLFEDCSEQVLDELLKYQNQDGGFGHGLEPDNQTPESSVLATDIAITILDDINSSSKEEVIKRVLKYYASMFNEKTRKFKFIPKSTNNYPRAVWWNYDDLDSWSYFNPTPEVTGFMYKYKHLTDFPVEELMLEVKDNILSNYHDEEEHSLYSVLKFYNWTGKPSELNELLEKEIESKITLKEEEWDKYSPQPYKLIEVNGFLYERYRSDLLRNAEYLIKKSDNYIWYPEWQWFQFEEVFENEAKYQWMGYVTYERLKFLKSLDKLKSPL